jgi:hypothetical protein
MTPLIVRVRRMTRIIHWLLLLGFPAALFSTHDLEATESSKLRVGLAR